MEYNWITGNKISLKPISYDDTSLIIKWRNNPNVKRFFLYREDFTKEMHEKWMKEKVATKKVIQYIIIENVSCNPIGSVYFRDVDYQKQTAEFGIFIGEDNARGKGYGAEATERFAQYGKTLGLQLISLRVFLDNTAAIKSYLKAGFVVSGQKSAVASDGEKINIQFMEKALV